jgi:hypothetical protein
MGTLLLRTGKSVSNGIDVTKKNLHATPMDPPTFEVATGDKMRTVLSIHDRFEPANRLIEENNIQFAEGTSSFFKSEYFLSGALALLEESRENE